MDLKLIETLIKEMDKSNLTTLEIEENGFKIRMEKNNEGRLIRHESIIEQEVPVTTKITEIPEVKEIAESNVEIKLEGKEIVSPMVGTFYAAQSPDEPPFIKVGDKVKEGQVLCIIEAMKLMNEIESDIEGEVVSILVENEEMVEFGQPLFIIK